MTMKVSERLSDVESILFRFQTSEEAFAAYYLAYKHYRVGVTRPVPVEKLLPLNAAYRESKRSCRLSFQNLYTDLLSLKEKYKADAIGEVVNSVLTEINGWNHDYVRAKYAAIWMKTFASRFSKLLKFGKNLNASKPRQAQIRKIAKQAFDKTLKPASKPAIPPSAATAVV